MPSTPANVPPRPLHTWAVCVVLFAGTVLLFERAFDYGFTNYDDPSYVTENARVLAGLSWDSVKWAFTSRFDYWHPVTWLSHLLDGQLYGLSASGHHVSSVLVHALNAVLAFLVLRRLTGAHWTSAFAAALFAWHPLRVESVVWIAERKDVLSGCFFLLTLWAYSSYAERRRAGRPAWVRFGMTLGLFAIGLMCKPMLVTLPAVLLLVDFWPLRRAPLVVAAWPDWRRLLVEKLPFAGLSVLVALLTVRMARHEGAFVLTVPAGARIGNAFVSVARYLGKLVWPFDLAVCYPHPGYWPAAAVAASGLLVLTVTAIAWSQRSRRPWLLAGWAWFIIMLLPVIGLVQVGFQAMADRYTYLPILGVQLAVLWTLRDWRPLASQPALAAGLGAAVLLAGAARTWNQEAVWRSPTSLFRHALAVTRDNSVAEGFLGYTLAMDNQTDEASIHLERAIALNPRNRLALFALGRVREKQARIEKAITCYRAAWQLDASDAESEYRLGRLLLRTGQQEAALPHMIAAVRRREDLRASNFEIAIAESRHGNPALALAYFSVALAARPDDVAAHFEYGLKLVELGRVDEALAQYREVLKLQPDHAAAHAEIGRIHLQQGDAAAAVPEFQAALANHPELGIAQLGLARACLQLGRLTEAEAAFQRARDAMPDDAAVENAWAEACARQRRFADAVPHYQRAIALRPNDAGLHAALGFVLYFSNRPAEALAAWDEALRLDPMLPGLRDRAERLRAGNP
ncbi:MAG TPA: tetratricopeptide repeat protein [Lacunisphaera sp.]|nr:tetratricopeptide repeat protein [Lacunisphaera sp.]